MEDFEQQSEQPDISLLAEVPAIQESSNYMFRTRDEIKDFVEQPLLGACEDMWDKNVRTLSTSANKKDIKLSEVHIIIDFDNLSEENQRIALQYCQTASYGYLDFFGNRIRYVRIAIPVSEDTTADEISKKASEMAGAFNKQSATWIPKLRLEYLKEIYHIEESGTKYDDPSYWEERGYYYDPESKLFYLSEEHYKKANEEMDVE